LEIEITFSVPTFAVVANRFVVVTAFETNKLPVTVKLVIVTTSKLDVLATLSVVEFTNGIVSVSKLNTVLVAFEVKPDDTILVVVRVFANTFVVEREFEAVRLLPITNEFRLEIEITFRVPTLAVVATRFVVKEFRLEIEITFRVETFAVVANRFVVKEFRLEIEITFSVETFAVVAKRFVVKEFRLEIEITFRVPTFAVVATRFVVKEFRFEIEITFSIETFAVVAKRFVVVTALDA
jgi:hypothetical protein